MSHPAALLVGTGPNIGAAVANALLTNGYQFALAFRMIADKTTSDETLHKARVEWGGLVGVGAVKISGGVGDGGEYGVRWERDESKWEWGSCVCQTEERDEEGMR